MTGEGTQTELEYLRRRVASLEAELASRHTRDVSSDDAVLDNISDGFIVFDSDWRYTYANSAAERLTGFARLELLGRSLWDIFPDLLGTAIERELRRAVAEQTITELEQYYFRRKKWFRIRCYPLRTGGASVYFLDITDTRRAEEELRQSREFLADITTIAPVVLYIYDLASRRNVWVNRSIESTLGYSPDDVRGNDMPGLLHPEDAARFPAHLDSLQNVPAGTATEFEYRMRHRDGSWRWLVSRDMPWRFGPDGTVEQVIGAAQDVTGRKHTELEREFAHAEFRKLQIRLQAVIEQMPAGLILTEVPGGRIISHNAEAERILGHPILPVADHSEYSRYGGLHADGTPYKADEYPAACALLNGEVVRREDMIYRRGDGTLAYLTVNAAPVKDGDRTVAVVCTFDDNTAQKSLEMALIVANERLTVALEANRLGTFDWDLNSNTVVWGGYHHELFGLGEGEFEGTFDAFLKHLHPEDREAIPRLIESAIANREERFNHDYRAVKPDGGLRWFGSQATFFYDVDGRANRMLGVVQDVTERHHVELALRRSNEDLERFAYVASHDMQEPLRVINSYSQLLLKRCRGQLDSSAEEYLHYLMEGSQRLSQLVRDLLVYARSGSTEGKRAAPVDSNAALQLALNNLRGLVEETAASITWDPLPLVLAVESPLAQVFQNLIGNAMKYAKPGVPPEVHIAAKRHESEWTFSIQDNGLGIEPRFHEQIFGLFTRLHSRDVSGTGIGLATCKRIIEQFEGRIWVNSQPGVGSTFCFTLRAV